MSPSHTVGSEQDYAVSELNLVEGHHPTRWARNGETGSSSSSWGCGVTIPPSGLGTQMLICGIMQCLVSPSHTVGLEHLRQLSVVESVASLHPTQWA